jgi:hypothetical protein
MSRSRAPWWMYIVAASLLGNFTPISYLYFWGPRLPFSRFHFKTEKPWWWRGCFQTRQGIGREYRSNTEC